MPVKVESSCTIDRREFLKQSACRILFLALQGLLGRGNAEPKEGTINPINRRVRLFPGEEVYVWYPSSDLLSMVKMARNWGTEVPPLCPEDLNGNGKIDIFDIAGMARGFGNEPIHLYAQNKRDKGVDFLQLTFVPPDLFGWNIPPDRFFELFSRLPQNWPGLQQPVSLGIEIVAMIEELGISDPRQSRVRSSADGELALVLTWRDLNNSQIRNDPKGFNQRLMTEMLEILKGKPLTKEEKSLVPLDILTLSSLPVSSPRPPGWFA